MAGLVDYEAGLCDCGWHSSLTADEANHFTFEIDRCPVCAGGDRFQRKLEDRDQQYRKRFGDDMPADRQDPADGRKVRSKLLAPD